MKPNIDFWKNKKVFITGHTGFKGTWLSLWLEMMGAEIYGFSLEPVDKPNLFSEVRLNKKITNIFGDIRDYDFLQKHLIKFNPDIVIHMAAQPLVRQSYIDPLETFSTNIMGTANLLEVIRKCDNIKAVVNITTDKCYENKEWHWGYREDEALGGYDPYSSSKACSELITSAYRSSYFRHTDTSIASARAGNVIGGGDWSCDRLIPDILRSFEKNIPVLVRNPTSIRPWQHVLEPISGYLVLAEKLFKTKTTYAEAWNFGPNDEDSRSVEWILNEIINIWGDNASWEKDCGENPHEANYLKLDISKVKNRLNWRPTWQIDKTLEKIVVWHKNWLAGVPAIELCHNDIHTFIKDNNF